MASISSPAGLQPRTQEFSEQLKRIGHMAAEFIAIVGAASRVGQAVESRREPALADLRILGIAGRLPSIR